MKKWRVELREDGAKWFWDCYDGRAFVCSSPYGFRTSWEAFRNFSQRLEDYVAQMKHRFAH